MTHGRTDGIAVASTALAMRRAVKKHAIGYYTVVIGSNGETLDTRPQCTYVLLQRTAMLALQALY